MSDAEEEKTSSGRGWMVGVGVVVLAVVGGVGSMIAFDEGALEPAIDPAPTMPRPTVTPSPVAPTVRPSGARVSLPPPPDVQRPERPENARVNTMTPGMRQEMNYFVDGIIKAARDECILPWMDDMAPATTAEFVFDTVLYDGQMYDVGIKSLDHDLPDDVRGCIGDKAWGQELPELDLEGEIRLQRASTFRRRD